MATIHADPSLKYQRVKQEDVWGCAAACAASLIGTTYAQALDLLEQFKGASVDSDEKGFEIDEIARCLYSQGIRLVGDWNPPDYPIGSILCINGEGYEDFHYVLVTPNGLMDPCPALDMAQDAKFTEKLPPGTSVYVALVPG